MGTTPKGRAHTAYSKLTKGELFHTAYSFFLLKHPEGTIEQFILFCKQEMKTWGEPLNIPYEVS